MSYDFFNKWAPFFMMKLVEDFKLSSLDVAAIIGNAGYESGGFKSLQEVKPLVPGSRGGYGIMQWTGPRRRAYESYCRRNGKDPSSMESNYAFLFVELKGPEGKVLPKLKKAETLEEKTEVFMKVFLRPGIEHLPQRIRWAQRALTAYEKDLKSTPTPTKEEKSSTPVPEPKRTLLDLLIDFLKKLLGK